MALAIPPDSGLPGSAVTEEKILEEIELLPSNKSISSTLRTWTLRWPHRGKTVAKLLLANEQNAFMVRELVAVWLYLRETSTSNANAVETREVSVLISKFSEYWCLLESLRQAASIESLWKVVSKFCRGEFVKRNPSQTQETIVEMKCDSALKLKTLKTEDGMVSEEMESDESEISTDEDEAAAQGLWMWWQHARVAAQTGFQHVSNTAAHTAAAAKRLRSG